MSTAAAHDRMLDEVARATRLRDTTKQEIATRLVAGEMIRYGTGVYQVVDFGDVVSELSGNAMLDAFKQGNAGADATAAYAAAIESALAHTADKYAGLVIAHRKAMAVAERASLAQGG